MCVLYFTVYICYLTKLKLASGNAYICNDRSGMKLRGKRSIFVTLFSLEMCEFDVMDGKRSNYLNKNQVCTECVRKRFLFFCFLIITLYFCLLLLVLKFRCLYTT